MNRIHHLFLNICSHEISIYSNEFICSNNYNSNSPKLIKVQVILQLIPNSDI